VPLLQKQHTRGDEVDALAALPHRIRTRRTAVKYADTLRAVAYNYGGNLFPDEPEAVAHCLRVKEAVDTRLRAGAISNYLCRAQRGHMLPRRKPAARVWAIHPNYALTGWPVIAGSEVLHSVAAMEGTPIAAANNLVLRETLPGLDVAGMTFVPPAPGVSVAALEAALGAWDQEAHERVAAFTDLVTAMATAATS
jgi:hypothetical protein